MFKRGWFHSDITTDNFLRWQVLTTILPRCTLYSVELQNLNPSTACFQEAPTLQLPCNCKTERKTFLHSAKLFFIVQQLFFTVQQLLLFLSPLSKYLALAVFEVQCICNMYVMVCAWNFKKNNMSCVRYKHVTDQVSDRHLCTQN